MSTEIELASDIVEGPADGTKPRPHPSGSLITISIPVFNEEKNISRLLERLDDATRPLDKYQFEFLFTDNHSEDRTFEILADEAAKDPRIRVVRFSRNFGFQQSILANYLNAKGEAAIQIDADLQDPPELFENFLEYWEKGYKVVYGVRRRRQEGKVIGFARKTFYKLVNRLSETDIPVDAGDFRLVDRVIIEHLRKVHDRNPYLRGIIAELGYAQIGIPYNRDERRAGSSKFGFSSLLRLAIDGLCSHSTRPIELISSFGFLLSFITFLGVAIYVGIFLFSSSEFLPSGFTTIVLLLLLSIGINAIFVGIIGEYIGRIFKNTRDVPTPIVIDRIEPRADTGTVEIKTELETGSAQ